LPAGREPCRGHKKNPKICLWIFWFIHNSCTGYLPAGRVPCLPAGKEYQISTLKVAGSLPAGRQGTLPGSQSYQKPLKKFRGFYTAFFQQNQLEIPVLGLKKSQ